jgi:hypothetical protein
MVVEIWDFWTFKQTLFFSMCCNSLFRTMQ